MIYLNNKDINNISFKQNPHPEKNHKKIIPIYIEQCSFSPKTLDYTIPEILKPQIDFNIINKLKILNLRKLTPMTISGGTFAQRRKEDLLELKNSGVQNVIDFRSEANSILGNNCEKLGLRYFWMPLDGVMNFSNQNYFEHTKDGRILAKPKFVKLLKKYFDTINSGQTYFGCHYGIDRTNIGVLLNYLLNPKAEDAVPEMLNWPTEHRKSVLNKNIKLIKKLYKMLTEEQKEFLGITEVQHEEINKRIVKLLLKNIYRKGGSL